MPRYFFHLVKRTEVLRDDEGSELPDLEQARLEALNDARHLMAEAIRSGKDISSRSVQICDEAGNILLLLPFVDALTADD
ncbi:hypothetical protein QBK99_21145 [Corticibacterium sp. UT-5YL-CI-8]|nr:hypothetical protein [Tianweitania sp. UT-5YL-CI-8]